MCCNPATCPSASSASRFFGHGSKRRQRLWVVPAAERLQRRHGQCDVVDRRVVERLKPPPQPTRRNPAVPPRVLQRDQRRQVKELDQRRAPDLAQRRFCDEQVAAFGRLWKIARGWPCAVIRPPVRGRSGTGTLPASCSPLVFTGISAAVAALVAAMREAGAIRGGRGAGLPTLRRPGTFPAGVPQRQSKDKRSLSDSRPLSVPVTTYARQRLLLPPHRFSRPASTSAANG